jgi:predicted GH43/DUF377 family glycosyl hydrolase
MSPRRRTADGVHLTAHAITPDAARVVAKTFLPGQEFFTQGKSRASAVLERVLAMTEFEVETLLEEVVESFAHRHRDLNEMLEARFLLVAHRIEDALKLTHARRRLIGAYFTQEYAVEAAALFNPSMVAHPDQSGLPAGTTRFIMSLRGVGEGHISSVEFRTGTIDADDFVVLDGPSGLTALPTPIATVYSKAVFAYQLSELVDDHGSAQYVMASLPETFGGEELDAAIASLSDQGLTRGSGTTALDQIEHIAACNYSMEFSVESAMDERVIIPTGPSESHGLEDVRFVRFTDADGTVEYRGPYTAFDGLRVVPQMMRTTDFRTFHVSQLAGPAAKDKGMALFPRQVHGDYLALSRWDRENNTIALSDDLRFWEESSTLQVPRQAWEIIQVGNCGSPIETAVGWLVLTHGVGPMRQYSIGAMLLDLEDPRVVLGRLTHPLVSAAGDDRDGYVPNVVYSCGSLLHGDTLVLPYG